MGRFLQKFTVFELILLALIGAAGIAVKPFVVMIAHLITAPLLIPGGSLAGGFYMSFIVLGGALINKRGAVTITCLVQGIIVLISGVYGSHGMVSLITYLLPGIFVDALWILLSVKIHSLVTCFLAGIVANVSGSVLVNFVFFRLPLVPLLLSSALAAFSGGLGGILIWQIVKRIKKLKLV